MLWLYGKKKKKEIISLLYLWIGPACYDDGLFFIFHFHNTCDPISVSFFFFRLWTMGRLSPGMTLQDWSLPRMS